MSWEMNYNDSTAESQKVADRFTAACAACPDRAFGAGFSHGKLLW
jgi:hypothetical protein